MNKSLDNSHNGIEASLAELIRLRPNENMTGFAPGGKVSTHQFGSHHSMFRGRGIEFDETRIYQPGDDVKTIDWRVTARTGTMHTKLFHEERERPVQILIDCRSMMHFGSQVRFKSVLAAQLAALLCWIGIDGGDRVGGFLLGQKGLTHFPVTRSRSTMLTFLRDISNATRTLDGLNKVDDSHEVNQAEIPMHMALRRVRHVSRPGSLIFIVSDFNDFNDLAEVEIKRLALLGQVTNILVYDQLDQALPERGDYRISNGNDVIALPGLGKQLLAYQEDFSNRRTNLEKLSRQRRMSFMAISTAEDPQSVLLPSFKNAKHQKTWSKSA